MKVCLMAIFCYWGILLGGGQVQGASTDQRVFDEAQLFSQDESELLTETIEMLQSIMNVDVIVATIEDALGYSTFDFADMFYDEFDFGVGTDNSGVLLLIDMDNREFDILTEGIMIDYLTDARIEAILVDVFNEVVDGNFYEAADKFLTLVRTFYEEGLVEGQYRLIDQRVFDDVQVFSEREVQELAQLIHTLENIMDMDIFVLTVNNMKDTTVYEFYEEIGLNSVENNDVILVIDAIQLDYQIASRGEMAQYLTPLRLDSIADSMDQSIANGNFYQATELLLNQIRTAYEAGLPVPPITGSELVVMLGMAAGVGFAFYKSVVRKYEKGEKKPRFSPSQNSQLSLKKERDIFLHRRVSKTRLTKNPPSSNSGTKGGSGGRNITRSTTRTASSGRSRGGGGRSF